MSLVHLSMLSLQLFDALLILGVDCLELHFHQVLPIHHFLHLAFSTIPRLLQLPDARVVFCFGLLFLLFEVRGHLLEYLIVSLFQFGDLFLQLGELTVLPTFLFL